MYDFELLYVLLSLVENFSHFLKITFLDVQQIPHDLLARLSSEQRVSRPAVPSQVWLTAGLAVSHYPGLTQSWGQLSPTIVGRWRHRALTHQRLCPADHTVLQLTLFEPTCWSADCFPFEWIILGLQKGRGPLSCPGRNRMFPTDWEQFVSIIFMSRGTEKKANFVVWR